MVRVGYTGQLSAVNGQKAGEANKSYAAGFSYTAAGAVSAMQMGNGLVEQTGFNQRLQPTQIKLGTAGSPASVVQLDYGYGTTANNGNLLSQTITAPKTAGGSLVLTQTYGYDSLNRLVSAGENGTAWQQTYDLDRFGNRAVRATSYIPNPQLTPQSASLTDFSAFDQSNNRLSLTKYPQVLYDGAGNLKRDQAGSAFTYDGESRQLTSSVGGVSANYFYDGDGRRVKKVVGTVTTVFVYNASGQLVAEYVNDPVPPPVGGGGTSYLTSDYLGSTRVVTKADGSVKARYDYLPYGEELSSAIGGRSQVSGYGVADSTRQKFTAKGRDAESGLDYFGARYYSSAQGRFTSVDPHNIILEAQSTAELSPQKASAQVLSYLAAPQQWNRYANVANNPLIYIDPTGEILELTGNEEERKKAFERIKQLVGPKGASSLYVREENGHYFVETKGGGALDASGKLGVIVNDVISSITLVQFRVSSTNITQNAAGQTINLGAGDRGGGFTGRFVRGGKSFIQIIVAADAGSIATSAARIHDAVGDDGRPLTYTNDVADAHEFGHAYFYIKNLARFENASSWWQIWRREETIGGLMEQSNRTSVDVENWARERRGLNKRTEH
jgi:RHS repeat-associated protein